MARKSEPKNADILTGIGFVRRRQGKLEQAVANLEQALVIDPQSAMLAGNLGETYFLLRDYPITEQYYDRAIRLNPEQLEVYAGKAWLYLSWKGDTKMAHSILEESSQIFGSKGDILIQYTWVLSLIFESNYPTALRRLQQGELMTFDSPFYTVPKELLYAQIYGLMNQAELEQAYYDSARIILEARVVEQPRDERFHSALGIAYAGLGFKDNAIEAGEQAVELLPIQKEAFRGAYRVADLARIYVMVGEHNAAIDQLEQLLSIPSQISVPLLRIDPIWRPLLDQPRFQKILLKYGESE